MSEPLRCPKCEITILKDEKCWLCEIRTKHLRGCPHYQAAARDFHVACEHGYDVCPTCDPCVCDI